MWIFSKHTVFTWPNAISLFRLLVMPFYIHLFRLEENPQAHVVACALLSISCISDLLDGFIARRTNSVTLLGKILDPLADKCTQFSLLVLIVAKYTQMLPVILLFLIKELFQLFAGAYFLKNGKMLKGALAAGKISTAVLFSSCLLILGVQQIRPSIIGWIRILDVTVLSISFWAYLRVYFFRNTYISKIDTQ